MLSSLGILIAIVLVFIELFSFYLIDWINYNKISAYWIIPIMILYSFELLLFYWGIQSNSVATLNFIWTICSIVGISATGYLVFKEPFTTTQLIAFLFGMISVILFLWSSPSVSAIFSEKRFQEMQDSFDKKIEFEMIPSLQKIK